MGQAVYLVYSSPAEDDGLDTLVELWGSARKAIRAHAPDTPPDQLRAWAEALTRGKGVVWLQPGRLRIVRKWVRHG